METNVFNSENLAFITKVVNENHSINKRIDILGNNLFYIRECAMGSGGLLQVKQTKKTTRVQISYAHGKYNYAYCVIFTK